MDGPVDIAIGGQFFATNWVLVEVTEFQRLSVFEHKG